MQTRACLIPEFVLLTFTVCGLQRDSNNWLQGRVSKLLFDQQFPKERPLVMSGDMDSYHR